MAVPGLGRRRLWDAACHIGGVYGTSREMLGQVAWGLWCSEEKSRLKYMKFGSGAFNGAAMDGAPAGQGMSMGALLWNKVFNGPRTQESRRNVLCSLEDGRKRRVQDPTSLPSQEAPSIKGVQRGAPSKEEGHGGGVQGRE